MKKVGEVLLFVLGGIVKTVSYLMVTLGLWLPTLFTVAFFVSVAVVNAPLSSRVMAVFYGGLAFTLAAGIGLAMGYSPSLKKRRAEQKLKQKRKLKAVREDTRAAEKTQTQENYLPPQETAMPENTSVPTESTMRYAVSTPPREDDYSDLHRKYFSTEPKRAPEQNDMSEEAARLWARLSGAEIPDEQPLVFRMRSDENVFVYEYSDRYQYWRRTAAGMRLEHTQYKATADADPSKDASRAESVSSKADKT